MADFATRLDDLRRRVLDRLSDEGEQIADLAEAISRKPDDAQTASELRAIAHRIRGTAGSFGQTEIYELAGRIEDELSVLLDDRAGQERCGPQERLRGLAEEFRAAVRRERPGGPARQSDEWHRSGDDQ